MKLLYPRCCVLDVQQQHIVACLRLQDVDGPAHKEVRTFGSEISDVVVLSNWLAGHGVTHVAIKPSAESWKPLYQALQQAFTVLLIDPAQATEVGYPVDRRFAGLRAGAEPGGHDLGCSRSPTYVSTYTSRPGRGVVHRAPSHLWGVDDWQPCGSPTPASASAAPQRPVAATPGELPTLGGRALHIAAACSGTHT